MTGEQQAGESLVELGSQLVVALLENGVVAGRNDAGSVKAGALRVGPKGEVHVAVDDVTNGCSFPSGGVDGCCDSCFFLGAEAVEERVEECFLGATPPQNQRTRALAHQKATHMAHNDDVETHPEDYVKKVGLGDYRVHTEIDIDAPASTVWETLTDFEHYEWSSSFKGLDRPVEQGAKVTATFHMMGKDQTIDHELIDVDPGVQWAWSDQFAAGMIDHHVYRVEPIDETKSRFIQRDRPHGGAAVVAGRLTARSFRKMYETFNSELKAEAERRYSTD